ncbi:hypothetical protein ABDJ38_04590 [Aurantiacibacter sp. DGU5]|uniref:Uncharacterized protein n=1 Tax=Aurantiacibacter flavus TaxID=3145232 RepID=A0ABV0CU99_9SPHN
MTKFRTVSGVLSLACGALATSVSAQDIAPQAITLIEGVLFTGEGGVELLSAEDSNRSVVRFWRPIQFTKNEQAIGGRMECRAAAERAPIRATWDDHAAIYEAENKQGSLGDFTEIDTRFNGDGTISRFDVLGRRSDPLRYEVRSYIAVRTGAELVNIRETCQFLRDGQIARQNFFQYVDHHTSFVLALAPPAEADPAAAPSLDTLTEIPS